MNTREHREWFRDVLFSISDAVIATDSHGQVDLLNPVAEALTGWKQDDARGRPLANVFHMVIEETRLEIENPAVRVLRQGHVEELANHALLIARDGTERIITGYAAPIRNEAGKIIGVVLVFADRTTEHATQRMMHFCFNLTNGVQEPIYCLDPAEDFRVVYLNDAACKHFGYTREQLLAMSPADWDPDFPLPKLREFWASRTGAPVTFETTHRTADGRLVPVEVLASVLNIDGRELSIGAIRDITARKQAQQALRRSTDLLRLFIEHSPAAIAMLDRDMKYIMTSRHYLIDYNLGESNLIGRSHYEVFPEIPERWREMHRKCLAGAVERADEDPFPRVDGSMDWVRWEVCPWHEQNGEIGGIILFSEVITKRKREQEALVESERKYRALTQNLRDLVYRTDAATLSATFVNEAVEEIYGYTREEWLGDPALWEKTIHPQDKERVLQLFGEARRQAIDTDLEYRIVRKDGAEGWVIDRSAWERADDGRVVALNGVISDITARKQAEEALRQKTEEIDRFFTLALDLLCIADTDGFIRRLNPQWEATLGYTLKDMEGKRLLDFVHPDDVAATQEAISKLASGKTVLSRVNRYRCKDGTYRWLEWRSTLYRDKLIYAAARDITESRDREEKLSRTNERFTLAARAARLGVWDWQISEERMVWDDRTYELFGIKKEDFSGTREAWIKGIHPDDIERVKSEAQQVLRGERELDTEFRVVLPDGTIRQLKAYGQLVKDTEGRPQRLIGIYSDITDRKHVESALRQSEADLKRAQQIAKLGSWIYDLSGQIRWSEEMYRIYGVSADTFVPDAESFIERIHPEDRPAMRTWIEACVGEKRPGELEFRTILPDGAIRFVSGRGELIYNAEGRPAYMSGTAQDITERKRVEETLRESEERYRNLLEVAPVGIAVHSGGKIVFTNPEGMRLFGATSMEQAIGKPISEIIHPDRLETSRARISRMMAGEKGLYPVEDVYLRLDRTPIDVEVMASALTFEGKPAVQVIVTDITERKRAEVERGRLIAAIEQAGETVIITDPEGMMQYVNPAFEIVTGYSRREAIGQNPRMFNSGMQGEAFYRELWGTITAGKTWQGRMVNKRKDGKLFTEEATISPVSDAAGRIVSYVAVKRDITAQQMLEDQLRQAQKMESVGRLAGGVAHDFNNMLQVIISYVEMSLLKVDAAQPLHKNLLEIRRAAQRSAEITGQLLAFARKQTVSPKVLDLNDAVSGTQKMIQRLIGEEIDLAWMPGHDLGKVKIDPSQLDQILANLAVNARDAINGVGKLIIETEKAAFDEEYCATHPGFVPGEHLLLAVSDDGCGMDKETMSHIFEPFFTTKEEGKGTGLGLATVYGIVKQNNGFINVYSELGHGTTFKVYLPCVKESASVKMEAQMAAPREGTETVLVVEDEAAILELAREMLVQLGYKVLTARTPEEAVRKIEEHPGPIHLLITDVVMPQMNGKQLADRLRASRPEMKCLFMSGYTADVIAHRGILEEGVSFIAKPFSLNVLAQKVREVLGE